MWILGTPQWSYLTCFPSRTRLFSLRVSSGKRHPFKVLWNKLWSWWRTSASHSSRFSCSKAPVWLHRLHNKKQILKKYVFKPIVSSYVLESFTESIIIFRAWNCIWTAIKESLLEAIKNAFRCGATEIFAPQQICTLGFSASRTKGPSQLRPHGTGENVSEWWFHSVAQHPASILMAAIADATKPSWGETLLLN